MAILCNNLRPEDGLLIDLIVARAIKHDHVTEIKTCDTDTAKTKKLIEILMRSPVSSYVAFMSCLQKEREDLYKQVVDVQKNYCGKIRELRGLNNKLDKCYNIVF